MNSTQLEQPISDFRRSIEPRLDWLARRLRQYVLVHGLSRVAVTIWIACVAQLSLDWMFRLRVDLRATMLALLLAVSLNRLWRLLVVPLSKPIGHDDLAALLERRYPELNCCLVSALEFSQDDSPNSDVRRSPALMAAVVAEATGVTGRLALDHILDHRAARQSGMLLALAVVAFILPPTLAPNITGIWFSRNVLLRETPWPQDTTMIVQNDDDNDHVIATPLGDDLTIRIQVSGLRPRQVHIALRFESGQHEQHTMTAVGTNEFRITIPRLTETLSFEAWGGDAETGSYSVRLVERPRLSETRITVVPPAYTRLPRYDLQDDTSSIEVLHGSEILFHCHTTKPLQRAVWNLGQSEIAKAEIQDGSFTLKITPTESGSYHFQLLDEHGLASKNPHVFGIKLRPDAEPRTELIIEGVGDLLTKRATLPVVVEINDEYGLDNAALHYRSDDQNGNTPITHALGVQPGTKNYREALAVRLLDLDLLEGQQLHLHAQASDQNTLTGPSIGRSAQYVFRIVSDEELMAELGRREQEYRQEFERVIRMQERTRDQLLSLATQPEQHGRTSELEARQRQIVRQTAHARSQYMSLYGELKINGLDSKEAYHRLIANIAIPLDDLAVITLPTIADTLAQMPADTGSFSKIDSLIQQALSEMNEILNNMGRWEGYYETIRLMQSVIEMQEALRHETQDNLDKQLEELLGEDQ